uniref:Uncharacterized protein n=1 Tax=Oryza brachyantha TaxID=4533 RepID=J3LAS8_ORYBR
QALVLAGRALVQHLGTLRRGHPIVGAVHHQERRRHLPEAAPQQRRHADELPHRPHPRRPPPTPRHPHLLRVTDRLADHLLVRHHRPCVGEPEEEPVQEEPHAGRVHVVGDDEQRRRQDEPRPPGVRRGAEVGEHRGGAAHGLAEEEGREGGVGAALAHGEEEGERRRGDGLHVPEVAADALGAAVAEEVGAEDGVPPPRVADGEALEHPGGVGAVAVGHEHDAPDVAVVGGGQRVERVREQAAAGGLVVGLRVAETQRGVVLVGLRGVAPEVLRRRRRGHRPPEPETAAREKIFFSFLPFFSFDESQHRPEMGSGRRAHL